MSRSWIKIALVSLSLSAALPALAFAGERDESSTRVAKGDKAREKNFPMKADAFIGKVNERITKMRARMDQRMDDQGLTQEKQKEALAKFDAQAEKVRAAAKTAGEDGTVTAEEAKTVREQAKELRGKHHKGKKGEGKGKKNKDKKKGSEA